MEEAVEATLQLVEAVADSTIVAVASALVEDEVVGVTVVVIKDEVTGITIALVVETSITRPAHSPAMISRTEATVTKAVPARGLDRIRKTTTIAEVVAAVEPTTVLTIKVGITEEATT